MGNKQIGYLKLLGYEQTDEDGAILCHPYLSHGVHRYVWKGEKFEDVLANYSHKLVEAERERMAWKITKG